MCGEAWVVEVVCGSLQCGSEADGFGGFSGVSRVAVSSRGAVGDGSSRGEGVGSVTSVDSEIEGAVP